MYHVYFLQSEKDGGYYIGCTSLDPDLRLERHNAGMVRSTKYRLPFKLVYVERYGGKQQAFRREFYLKTPEGYKEKLEIIRAVSSVGRASH